MNELSSPLVVSNLDIKIGDEWMLKQVNLEIKTHEFVTLMGENGAGKTMFIDTLLGFRQPSTGSVRFFGEELKRSAREAINQKVGWVVSHHESYPTGITIRNFFNSIKNLYPTWDDALVSRLEDKFQLNLGKKLSYLSLGERSKVKLIKALAFHPQLIILDELTANLSPASKKIILETIIDLFSSSNLSVLYISHFEDEASKLSDKIITLNGLGSFTNVRSSHE